MLSFGDLLDLAGINRSEVRLLRHKSDYGAGYPSIYALWRDHRDRFDAYQALQDLKNEASLRAPYWASFVSVPGRETLFVGIYSAELLGLLPKDQLHPVTGALDKAGVCHIYKLEPLAALSSFAGRLWIEWGDGHRSWIQRGDRKSKAVVELRKNLGEDPFPGFQALILHLSDIDGIPSAWATALSSTRGVYLLTCPSTKEQYVGSASGTGGFLSRWQEYFATGHGGNVGLKSRDASNYQVSILETVGTGATFDDIIALEVRWKNKLQSREMGLNRN